MQLSYQANQNLVQQSYHNMMQQNYCNRLANDIEANNQARNIGNYIRNTENTHRFNDETNKKYSTPIGSYPSGSTSIGSYPSGRIIDGSKKWILYLFTFISLTGFIVGVVGWSNSDPINQSWLLVPSIILTGISSSGFMLCLLFLCLSACQNS